MILKNYQDNTTAQVIFKTDKDAYTLSLNKEEDHFNGTINLPNSNPSIWTAYFTNKWWNKFGSIRYRCELWKLFRWRC